jgi:hypothetical protein
MAREYSQSGRESNGARGRHHEAGLRGFTAVAWQDSKSLTAVSQVSGVHRVLVQFTQVPELR